MEKAREFQKPLFMCFIDYSKAFDCVDHPRLWNILQGMRIPEHITVLLQNLYTSLEATVRTEMGLTEWFPIGKGVQQGCILSPCLFNLYSENVMRQADLGSADEGVRVGGRTINNLRYADDTTLVADTEDGL